MARQLTQAALVAVAIRQWLRAEGIPGNVTSKNYSMGDSVTVRLVDQIPAVYERVRDYCAQYECGSFDGMQDIYNYDNVNRAIPQTKYLFVNNEMTQDLQQRIWDFARGYYNCLANLPADVTQVYNIRVAEMNDWAGGIPRRLFNGGYGDNAYWTAQNAAGGA